MPKVLLEQGTIEWLEWRKNKITATSAAVICNVCPHRSPMDLYNEMQGCNSPKITNAAMERGTRLEPEARAVFTELMSISVDPCCWEHDELSWMAASLDGISSCGRYLLEIKCPGKMNHDIALDGEIPGTYYYQMQHQLFVTGAERTFYFSYRPECKEKTVTIEVLPNMAFQEELVKLEAEFWSKICNMTPPENLWEHKSRKII